MKRRVVITGLGALSPIGNDVPTLWESIENCKCGIDKITKFDTSDFKVKLAGEVKGLDVEQYFDKRSVKFNDLFTVYARIAAKQAFEDSKIDIDAIDKTRFGVIFATGIGGIGTIEVTEDKLQAQGPGRVSPFFIPMSIANMAAGNVAIDLQAQGHCSSVVTACAAATNAIGEAFHKIRDGYEDIMMTGGCEAAVTPLSVAGFQSMKALHVGDDKNRASIPFDKDRSGFVMGEGAGALVLEEYEHAKKRGAKIYAEIVGYGATCDAFHITAPMEGGEGGARAMVNALKDASIEPESINYINAHGTSTPLNDKTETGAVKSAFGDHAYNLLMSSTKGNTGHLLGASGAIESIICVKAIENSFVPPTINYQNPDENCDLNIVANTPVKKELNYVMKNSLGFGGHNASLIFKKVED